MRVEVVLTLHLCISAIIVLVLELTRDRAGAPGLNILHRGNNAIVGRI